MIFENQEATIESIINKNHPVRRFNFIDFDKIILNDKLPEAMKKSEELVRDFLKS